MVKFKKKKIQNFSKQEALYHIMNALLNYKKQTGILLTEDIRFCKMVAEVFRLETLKKNKKSYIIECMKEETVHD